MERYRGKTGDDIIRDDDGDIVLYADAQATVEALQAQLEQVQEERSKYIHAVGLATTCVADMQIDTSHPIEMMQEVCKRFTRRTAELEAVREQLRLANIDQANAEARANDLQQQVEALQRERDQWKEAFERSCDDTAYLKAALDAERERVRQNLLTIMDLQTQLTQLQALVRALPKKVEALSRYRLFPSGLGMHPTGPLIIREDALKELIVLAATLDATTPAVCPDCDGDGAVDSGGTDPNGNPLMRRCGCREKGGDGE